MWLFLRDPAIAVEEGNAGLKLRVLTTNFLCPLHKRIPMVRK
jgi:hypothetical protein